jgi:outer membrane protein
MRKLITLVPAIGFIFLSLIMPAQTQLKIGHVNFEELMLALPERDSAQAVLDKETNDIRNAYEELTVAYNKLYDEYQKGLPAYSAVVKKNKEDELLDKQKRMADFEQNASQSLQKRNTELLTPIVQKITQAINKVATENGFTYILDISKGSVVFTSKDSQNINPLVLKILKQ